MLIVHKNTANAALFICIFCLFSYIIFYDHGYVKNLIKQNVSSNVNFYLLFDYRPDEKELKIKKDAAKIFIQYPILEIDCIIQNLKKINEFSLSSKCLVSSFLRLLTFCLKISFRKK